MQDSHTTSRPGLPLKRTDEEVQPPKTRLCKRCIRIGIDQVLSTPEKTSEHGSTRPDSDYYKYRPSKSGGSLVPSTRWEAVIAEHLGPVAGWAIDMCDLGRELSGLVPGIRNEDDRDRVVWGGDFPKPRSKSK